MQNLGLDITVKTSKTINLHKIKDHNSGTFDDRIFAKKDANGRKQLIKCVQDIDYLINSD